MCRFLRCICEPAQMCIDEPLELLRARAPPSWPLTGMRRSLAWIIVASSLSPPGCFASMSSRGPFRSSPQTSTAAPASSSRARTASLECVGECASIACMSAVQPRPSFLSTMAPAARSACVTAGAQLRAAVERTHRSRNEAFGLAPRCKRAMSSRVRAPRSAAASSAPSAVPAARTSASTSNSVHGWPASSSSSCTPSRESIRVPTSCSMKR
mmetsp:Transcript_38285/g.84103  ORF Transcript_38285/g.84103 Transcript_38285/m.84103 type:complete len:212 (-) Transcript_38285:671-1306(-)